MSYFSKNVACEICGGSCWQRRKLCSFCNDSLKKEYHSFMEEVKRDKLQKEAVYRKWWEKSYKEI